MSKDNGGAVATIDPGAIMEAVIAKGDLSKLTPEERAKYYARTCESMGMNPMSKPFEYITLNGKLTLYATRTATDQLRNIYGVSLEVLSEETTADGLRVVRVRASIPNGRSDEEIGAVNVAGLKADALANAYMKAITKAKRRATLSICGLGWLDETEVETIPDARRVPVSSYVPDDEPSIDISEAEYQVDAETGVIVEHDNTDESKAQERLKQKIQDEYLARILAAKSTAALVAIGEEMGANGVGSDDLREHYANRLTELAGSTKQRQLAGVGAAAGEAGADKFTS